MSFLIKIIPVKCYWYIRHWMSYLLNNLFQYNFTHIIYLKEICSFIDTPCYYTYHFVKYRWHKLKKMSSKKKKISVSRYISGFGSHSRLFFCDNTWIRLSLSCIQNILARVIGYYVLAVIIYIRISCTCI